MHKWFKSFSRRRISALLSRLPGAFYEYRQWPGGKCRFPYSSSSIENIFFASPRDLARDGQIAWSRICPEFLDEVRESLKASSETLTPVDMTFRVKSPQGRQCWVRMHSIPERVRDGSTLWYGHIEDITAEKEMEEDVAQKAALLEVIFEALPDQIYYMDENARLTGVNAACAQHHQCTPQSMIGKTGLDLYEGDPGRRIYREDMQVIEGGKTVRDRERHVLTNGSILYLDTIKCPLRNASGEVIGLAGISRDVTRQVEFEEALAEEKRLAEQSASFIKAIFDNLEDQFYYKDRQSRVLGGNKAWVKARGVDSLDELVGKTDIELQTAPLGQQLYENEQRQMERGETTRIRERHVLEDGSVIYLESIKCPMKNEQGDVIGLAGISRDVTRQVGNEKELIESQMEAEAANKAKSAFLAMMSHEIRTPMNGVIGAASLLMGTDLTPHQEEFVSTIQISGENLLTIINDILDYSKIEAGKIDLEEVPFDLRECIAGAFDLFVQPADKKNLELLYDVESDVPEYLTGDATRLRQILVNLLGNAIKFTEQGEISVRVQSILADEKKKTCQLQFEVKDTGVGIPEKAQARLFESFTQADASSTRKYGGTGLGLTICRRLTELMGGKIWFESTEGTGTVFYFTVDLPVAKKQTARKAPLPIEALRGKRALIVDDNETNRWLLSKQLAEWGVLSEAFESPQAALEQLRSGAVYDLALVDFQMPEMDGLDLARRIRRLEREDYPPVIILSSVSQMVPADDAVYAQLSKPVKMQQLSRQMLEALAVVKKASEAGGSSSGKQLGHKEQKALRILVAEDNPINRRVVEMMLQRLGYENTAFVEDGESAVAAAMDADYDVILMDVQMPHMSGLEAARQIRDQKKEKAPVIVALTAGVMEEERKAAEQAGMESFLAKPLNMEQLSETLGRVEQDMD